MIYLVANRENDTCKIGYSKHPEKRINDLQVGNSVELELIATMDGSQEDEQLLHKKFENFKIKGEWFILSDEILKCFNEETKVKFYDSMFTLVSKTDKTALKVFYYCAFNCQVNDNSIKLDKIKILKIKDALNIPEKAVRLSMTKLKKGKFLISEKNSIYRCNPVYIWKGDSNKRVRMIKSLLEKEVDLGVNITFI